MPHFLQAGPMRVRYENGFLRYLSVDEAEIIRMIYFAVRDRNWQTATITVSDEVIGQTADSFHVAYAWHVNELGIDMTGQVDIQGGKDGTIKIDFYGKALNDFQKNRIGLCVLHPLDGVLGQPAEITSPDGRITNSNFPVFISPHQPFLNIQTLRWKPTSGTTWQLDFQGDVFETEDQRNWTDTSFKTYSTPASLPAPVAVSTGDEFRQRVIFSVSKQPVTDKISPDIAQEQSQRIQATNEVKPTHPRIGVSQWAGGPPLTVSEADLLKKLNLSHLRTDVFFSLPDWQTLLTNAVADAKLLRIPLELAVFFGDEPTSELTLLQHFMQSQDVSIRSLLLYNEATLTTSDELVRSLVPVIRSEWPNVAVGGGTDDNFAELNGNPFNFDRVDFVVYSINPQAHATDDLTLQENIAGQAETVQTARQLSGGKPIHISPLTLRPRFITRAGTATERLNAPADLRQLTAFGADWTRQSLSALAAIGVDSITYYQSHGPAGLVSGDTVYPLFSAVEEYQNAANVQSKEPG